MFFILLAEEIQNNHILQNPDWSQFFPSVLATLVGFILAIVFQQYLYEKIKDLILNRNRVKNQIRKLKDELTKEVLQLCLAVESLYIDPIKTPVWEGVLNTNEIQLLDDFFKAKEKKLTARFGKSNGKPLDICEKLFEVYGLISEYNKWWNLYSEQRVAGREANKLFGIVTYLENSKNKLYAVTADVIKYFKFLIGEKDDANNKEN